MENNGIIKVCLDLSEIQIEPMELVANHPAEYEYYYKRGNRYFFRNGNHSKFSFTSESVLPIKRGQKKYVEINGQIL